MIVSLEFVCKNDYSQVFLHIFSNKYSLYFQKLQWVSNWMHRIMKPKTMLMQFEGELFFVEVGIIAGILDSSIRLIHCSLSSSFCHASVLCCSFNQLLLLFTSSLLHFYSNLLLPCHTFLNIVCLYTNILLVSFPSSLLPSYIHTTLV